ncbi:hypothetical protein [Streptomyces sp. NBC_01207]|nr:hypothetical protein OG457_00195 [Streptomyces sp. NBC_01207]
MKNKRTMRRLGCTAMFNAVRGASTAAGSAAIAAVIWWLGNR